MLDVWLVGIWRFRLPSIMMIQNRVGWAVVVCYDSLVIVLVITDVDTVVSWIMTLINLSIWGIIM